MNHDHIRQAAQALRSAREQRRTIARVSESFGIEGMDAAYAVAELNTRDAIERGRRIVGKKTGLTSRAVQQQLGVDQPDFGVLFADMEFLAGDTLPAGRLVQPKAEAEVAFVVGSDFDDPEISWARFLRGIEYALPAIEVVDSVIDNWRITLVDTIADNASCGLYVLGTTPRRIGDLDLAACRMRATLNGMDASEGSGAACLGNPLHAARWLARTLATRGQPLRAGDVVLSGALGPMFPVREGDRVDVTIEGLGRVFCDMGTEAGILRPQADGAGAR